MKYIINICIILVSILLSLSIIEFYLRNSNKVRNIGESFSRYDQSYGKWLKEDVQIKRITPEFVMKIKTDSMGRRFTPELSLPSKKILFLGDSFTMGYGVNDDEVFPFLIQKNLLNYNISAKSLNYGVGNTGNGRNLLIIKNKLESLKPDLIIIQLCSNDFSDNLTEKYFTLNSSGLNFNGIPKDKFSTLEKL